MEPSLLTSLIGIIIFSTIMYFGYKYADGEWKVSTDRNIDYQAWANKYGGTIKKSILVISVIWGFQMLLQVLALIDFM